MTTVDLIYDADCPNVRAARDQLLRAFCAAGLVPRWREWDRGDAASPPEVRAYASPTILVDGADVAPTAPLDGTSACRLYVDGEMDGRVPAIDSIVAALTRSARAASPSPATTLARRSGAQSVLVSLLGVGVALLPKLACPACWPAYAGLMSALGLGFLMKTAYLLPITAALLAFTVAALAYAAQRRGRYAPLALGATGAGVVLIGKFALDLESAAYAGAALLLASSLWSSGLRSRTTSAACCACAPDGSSLDPEPGM
jgi:hypothetical protein